VKWDPFASGCDDPFSTYRALREEHPVYHNADRGVWALTRFDDVQRAARDWRAFSNAAGVDLDDTTEVFGPGNFIDSDPRRHDELRGLVRHRFTPKAVAELERGIRRRTRDLLAPLVDAGGGDLASALAWPLPVATICDLVGFPLEDAGRRRNRDDLLGAIATGDVGGAPLTDEIAGLCTLLTVAGTETTFSLIGNMFSLLAERPEVRQRLAQEPSAIPAALEEILRCESPVQYLGRITTRDVEVHGTTIPAGERVALIFGAANRDGLRWEDPEKLDIGRPAQRNLAFGEGIHHCLGAPVARLEGRVVLEEIVMSMPSFALDGPVRRTSTYTTRGFESLPIAVDSRRLESQEAQ
jgi:cytochrome P450